jgi:hypothetical protein
LPMMVYALFIPNLKNNTLIKTKLPREIDLLHSRGNLI